MAKEKVIKNKSKAYGYNYTSLSDIANNDFDIPKMRVKPLFSPDGKYIADYIEYLGENGEWQLGSRVFIPEMRGSNESQRYGAGLTYSRRYTALMALGLACDDDRNVEKQMPAQQRKTLDISPILAKINNSTTIEELDKNIKEVQRLGSVSKEQATIIHQAINNKRIAITMGGYDDGVERRANSGATECDKAVDNVAC